MRRWIGRLEPASLALIVTIAAALACDSSPAKPGNPAAPGPETIQLLAALQRNGATAEVAEIMRLEVMPFSVPAVRVLVNGSNVHVFEYATVAVADAEAAGVSADGSSIGATQVLWVSTPHFFRGSRLIVLYVGMDPMVIEALASLLGPQFAGR